LVDEQALADALRRGHLGGAATDVLTSEPPSDDNPLLAADVPRLSVTPHSAWGSREARQRIVGQLAVKIELLYSGDASKALDEVRSGRVDILADARLVTLRLVEMVFVHPSIASLQTVDCVRFEPGFFYAARVDAGEQLGTLDAVQRAVGLDVQRGLTQVAVVAALAHMMVQRPMVPAP
ncbi:NAD(P)-dependent oxidoreductase, partial [Pseudomonas sp. FIP_A4]